MLPAIIPYFIVCCPSYRYASGLIPNWGDSMEVIIHLPRSKEGQEELAKRVATVHAQLIYNYISRLECSTEQKVALLDAIQENIHDEIKKEKEG